MSMDEVEFHCEPPTNVPTMVVAFGGWVDAGEAATSALRYLVRQLAATPLATDATGDETPRRRREDAFNPEQLMHELEDFLRQERERGPE
jgi:hypothetical protein